MKGRSTIVCEPPSASGRRDADDLQRLLPSGFTGTELSIQGELLTTLITPQGLGSVRRTSGLGLAADHPGPYLAQVSVVGIDG